MSIQLAKALLLSIGIALSISPADAFSQKTGPDELILVLDEESSVTMKFIWLDELNLYMAETEVTINQYSQYSTRDESISNYSNQPDFSVEWPMPNLEPQHAERFCNWLNKKQKAILPAGYHVRIPTVSEWIGAAKCGDNFIYPWGTDAFPPTPMRDGAYPNYQGEDNDVRSPEWIKQASSDIVGYRDGFVAWAPVVQSGMNAWGLYGMAGNVSEWCSAGKQWARMGGCFVSDYPQSMETMYVDIMKERPSPFIPFLKDRFSSLTTGFRPVITK